MNERVMQFRIGMFVIVAGLVLTMLLVWFGEAPTLLRDRHYVIVHYAEAPGVAEGIPVRKSGIRVGEVASIVFDERPNQPDGVLVTLSLDRKYHIRKGTIPRITRSLIGDASIDLLPGTETELLQTSGMPGNAPIIEGSVSPDPSKALAAATAAFEKVGDTLKSIDEAASGIANLSKSAGKLDSFLDTWAGTGRKVGDAADGIDRFIKANEGNIEPAVKNVREVAQKFNTAMDPATVDTLKTGLREFQSAAGRLDKGLESAGPLFKDLGASVNTTPTTDFGQTVRRLNLITSDVNLLTQALRGPNGKLNDEEPPEVGAAARRYDNMNNFAATGRSTLGRLRADPRGPPALRREDLPRPVRLARGPCSDRKPSSAARPRHDPPRKIPATRRPGVDHRLRPRLRRLPTRGLGASGSGFGLSRRVPSDGVSGSRWGQFLDRGREGRDFRRGTRTFNRFTGERGVRPGESVPAGAEVRWVRSVRGAVPGDPPTDGTGAGSITTVPGGPIRLGGFVWQTWQAVARR
ncbi:MAG: MlaD family protein [Isosphaeraceae bacterium]